MLPIVKNYTEIECDLKSEELLDMTKIMTGIGTNRTTYYIIHLLFVNNLVTNNLLNLKFLSLIKSVSYFKFISFLHP